MFCQHIFTTKALQTTLGKVFFVFIFCFVKHKAVKIFDIHVMWLVSISYKQKIHWVFKFLIWKVNWKNQFIFITIHINANFFCLVFTKIFFIYRKFDSIIIKTINKLIISLCNSFWMYFYGIKMPNMTPKKTVFIVIFDVD